MKMETRILFVLILVSAVSVSTSGQKHFADGSRLFRGNRLISTQSDAGQHLEGPERGFIPKNIRADGEMLESVWQQAQLIDNFLGTDQSQDRCTVRVLSDSENIYLFWELEEESEVTANIDANDEVIFSDDYVQLNLRPWLPDEITTRKGYYYSIAVNPHAFYWDAYFDPYLDGFFFSSWNSDLQVATQCDGNHWSVEMIVPFSGLDHYSDPRWKWSLDFVHSSYIRPGQINRFTPQLALVIEQGVRVRRPNLVQYYWTRPEFMEEVKPDTETQRATTLSATPLTRTPELDSKPDASLWKEAQSLTIGYSDRTGNQILQNTARAKIGTTKDHICFNLQADGARIDLEAGSDISLGEGMSGQTANVNGVFVDTALFVDECFWIILQPLSPTEDHIHQPYYLIIIDNHGKVRGTRYDRYGKPDRRWIPEVEVDLYETASGWGVESAVSFSCFDLPVDYDEKWGLNLFRNRLTGDSSGSELQAWRFTATDFLNPETFGTLQGLPTGNLSAIRTGLERRRTNLRQKLESFFSREQERLQPYIRELEDLSLDTQKNLRQATWKMETVDNRLGVAETWHNYEQVPHPTKGGYPILDVQLRGDVGWAVGAMGTVLRTEDGGRSWQVMELKHDADLQRVFFINRMEGWTVGGRIRMGASNEEMRHDERGGYGYIFHTRDGGQTWECQYGERGRHLFGLSFLNERVGYACGERGFLLKTEDGGQHWRESPTTSTLGWLYSIVFQDEKTGFAVGESEIVLKTQDGGKTWSTIRAPADRKFYGFRPFYRDITFSGSTGCIVGQNGSILISHDAGQNWHPTATFFDPHIREFLDFTRVHFVSTNMGYVVGELGTGIMVTEDGGRSWTLRPVSNSDWLRSVWAEPEGKIVLAGEGEKILLSENRGFQWEMVRGGSPKVDLLVMLAHGDDAAIQLGALYAHAAVNEGKKIVDIEVLRDAHSVEYRGEIYNLEHHRNVRLSGVRTTTYFDEFENGNNGCDYYHFTERLWEGEENVIRHMVAAIRAYRPEVVIVHGGVFGDYDKPGHKLSGRAGIPAFETSGGAMDHWPELTRLGLEPWQAKKLYALASESYPATLDLAPIGEIPLKGTDGTCLEWAEYTIRTFQSQGVYHARTAKLSLIESRVAVPEHETSVFDGLE